MVIKLLINQVRNRGNWHRVGDAGLVDSIHRCRIAHQINPLLIDLLIYFFSKMYVSFFSTSFINFFLLYREFSLINQLKLI